MTDYIKLNADTELQLFHTLFTGQTNLAGKTTAIRMLIPRATKLGYTILVFDTKPTVREFSGYHDIPICYRPTTDPLVLIGLLEAIFRRRITMYYGTLNRLTEDARDIPDIIRNAEEMELKARSGFIKDACHTLADLLRRLQKELKGLNLSSKLELKESEINIMPLNEVSTEAQQLVIKTAFELTLKHHNRRTILVIDEAFRFLPQGYSSACKQAVQDVVTQGAKTQLYVWLATQFIATTEKDAIKAMANKLLGRQDDKTEIDATIDRTRDTHPKLRQNDLMTLKRGEFIFVPIDGAVKKVYIPIDEKFLEPETETKKTALQIRAMKFKNTEPNPLAPDRSFSVGLKVGANEGLEAAAKKVEEIDLENKQIQQSLPNIVIQQFKPTLSIPVEQLNEPTTPIGRVIVCLKNNAMTGVRQDQWTFSSILKHIRNHAWPEDGAKEAIDQLIRWEILVRASPTSTYFKFQQNRVQVQEQEAVIPA